MSRRLLALTLIVLLASCTGGMRRTSAPEARAAAQTNVRLAASYYNQGRVELALDKIERALAIDPGFSTAHSVAGVIYDHIGDIEKAGRHYRRSVQLDGTDADALNNYGQFLCRTGDLDSGIAHLERAVAQPFYATPAAALTNAGDCAERKNDSDLAERFYRRALDTDAQYPDALFRLARLLLQNGDAFRARAFLQRLEASAQPSPEALLLGAEVEKALGNATASREYEVRLKQLFPESQQSRQGG